MHMADALVAPAVAATMYVCSGGAAGFSVKKVRLESDPKKIPVMGVMGAFVFAAQMINFTIPGTGSSGHLCGGMMLTALLGPYAAFLTMIGVLLIQCLLFADGGLLALGCNIWNMAFYGCFLGYFLFWRPMMKKGMSRGKIAGASILGCVVTLQLGAFSVALETLASGITDLPFTVFVATMQPIHLAIGLVEGLITAAVLLFVYEARPALLSCSEARKESRFSFRKTLVILGIAALVIGGAVSLAASSNPDGLEWSMERLTGSTELAHMRRRKTFRKKQHFCRTMDLKIPIPHWEPAFPELQVPQPFSLSVSAHAMHFDFSKRKKREQHGTGEKMNKLGNALYEIHHMDMLAAKDQWVNKIHPLVKLILTIAFLTVTMSFPKYDLTGLLRMGIYPIVLFIVGEISFRDSIHRLRIVLPLICFVGLFNPIFDRQVIGYIGTVPLTAGMLSMVTLMIKGIYSVLAAYLLIATTSIEKICYALRLVHIPAILVTQVLLTYRYVTVLLEEANRMTQAYSLRAPNQKGVHFKVWGTLAGQLLLRSMDRANEVYESMTLRGYQGEFYYTAKEPCKAKDWLYMGVWLVLFAVLKVTG